MTRQRFGDRPSRSYSKSVSWVKQLEDKSCVHCVWLTTVLVHASVNGVDDIRADGGLENC